MGFLFWKKKDKPEAAETSEPEITEVEAPVEKPKRTLFGKPKPQPEPNPEPVVIEPVEIVEEVVVPEPVLVVEEVVAEPEPEPTPEPEPVLEVVELPKRSFAKGIKSLFTRIKFDPENLDELEDVLIQADFGVIAAESIVAEVKNRAKKQGAESEQELKSILEELIAEQLERNDKELNLSSGQLPYVVLVVGVNGVGKTTTIGKLSKYLAEAGSRVVIAAADTFRAAAVEQIATWSERSGATLVRPKTEGQDPASVAFEGTEKALAENADVLIIDTAGRLQNKVDLMNELDKIRRVVEKNCVIAEVLLVIDATTGQNGMTQAKAFAEVAGVTGVALTKLDGTAKGGIVYSIQRELGIPVKLVGVGEGIADFAFFDAREFARGLVS